MIRQANRFNRPPSAGNEYLLVMVRLEYVEGPPDKSITDWDYSFKLVSSQGVVLERPSVVKPKPELGKELYPGGVDEGWIALERPQGDEKATVRLMFGSFKAREGWLSLVPAK